jgi:hypothetical protein
MHKNDYPLITDLLELKGALFGISHNLCQITQH